MSKNSYMPLESMILNGTVSTALSSEFIIYILCPGSELHRNRIKTYFTWFMERDFCELCNLGAHLLPLVAHFIPWEQIYAKSSMKNSVLKNPLQHSLCVSAVIIASVLVLLCDASCCCGTVSTLVRSVGTLADSPGHQQCPNSLFVSF